jgi:hypothetical protein
MVSNNTSQEIPTSAQEIPHSNEAVAEADAVEEEVDESATTSSLFKKIMATKSKMLKSNGVISLDLEKEFLEIGTTLLSEIQNGIRYKEEEDLTLMNIKSLLDLNEKDITDEHVTRFQEHIVTFVFRHEKIIRFLKKIDKTKHILTIIPKLEFNHLKSMRKLYSFYMVLRENIYSYLSEPGGKRKKEPAQNQNPTQVLIEESFPNKEMQQLSEETLKGFPQTTQESTLDEVYTLLLNMYKSNEPLQLKLQEIKNVNDTYDKISEPLLLKQAYYSLIYSFLCQPDTISTIFDCLIQSHGSSYNNILTRLCQSLFLNFISHMLHEFKKEYHEYRAFFSAFNEYVTTKEREGESLPMKAHVVPFLEKLPFFTADNFNALIDKAVRLLIELHQPKVFELNSNGDVLLTPVFCSLINDPKVLFQQMLPLPFQTKPLNYKRRKYIEARIKDTENKTKTHHVIIPFRTDSSKRQLEFGASQDATSFWKTTDNIDVINHLESCGFSINYEFFEFVLAHPEFFKKEIDKLYDRNTMSIDHQSQLFVRLQKHLAFLKEYKDQPLYFTFKSDFRGRIYPIQTEFNYQMPKLIRCLIDFYEAQTPTPKGIESVELAFANTFNECRLFTDDEKVEFVLKLKDSILNVKKDLSFLETSKDRATAVKCALELQKIYSDPTYKSRMIVYLDYSSSGPQLIAFLSNATSVFKWLNLGSVDRDDERSYDFYHKISEVFIEKASQTPESKRILDFLLDTLKVKITRSFFKKPTMTMCYGITEYGLFDVCVKQILDELHHLSSFDYRRARHLSLLMASYFIAILKETYRLFFPEFSKFLKASNMLIERSIHESHQIPVISTPYLFYQLHYCKSKKENFITRFEGKRRSVTMRIHSQEIDVPHIQRSIAPHLIHTLDAYNIARLVLFAKQHKIPVATIHDSIGIPMNSVPFIREYANQNIFKEMPKDMLQILNPLLPECFVQQGLNGNIEKSLDYVNNTHIKYACL